MTPQDRFRIQKTRGLILRVSQYRETSLVVELFSRDEGRFPVMAKGIRSGKSRHTGELEPLTLGDFTLHGRDRDSWRTFKEVDVVRQYLSGVAYRDSLFYHAAAELLLQMIVPEEDSHAIFDLTISYLEYLRKNRSANMIVIWWRYLHRLLNLTGHGVQWTTCVDCGKTGVEPSGFLPDSDGMICGECSLQHNRENTVSLTPMIRQILLRFNSIANNLDTLSISPEDIECLNLIFHLRFQEAYHKSFHWKSLDLLETSEQSTF